MRLKRLTVAGFRGFNHEHTIDFDDRLTLIAAPNSYGKTSISEALEFLIFGSTSKVEHADSKEEYRDSYRNRHYPEDKPAHIEAIFSRGSAGTATLRVEIDSSERVRRFVDGTPVEEWPFVREMSTAARPFVLQHALKYLLLVPPSERFQGFARLLGLHEVDAVQQALVNLCTKPEASIPAEAGRALSNLQALESRLTGFQELQRVAKDLKKGQPGAHAAYKTLESRADSLLGRRVDPAERLAQVIRARDDVASKVYSGGVALKPLSDVERRQLTTSRDVLSSTVSTTFLEDYGKLAARGAAERLRREAQLLTLGLELIEEDTAACPLCGQALDEQLREHISRRHEDLKRAVGEPSTSEELRVRTEKALRDVRLALVRHRQLMEQRSADLFGATDPTNNERLRNLFGKENETSWEIVQSASRTLWPLFDRLNEAATEVEAAITGCEAALRARTEAVSQPESLGKTLQGYLSAADAFNSQLNEMEPSLVGPARILRQTIDALAGTAELTLLIESLETRPAIERALQVREVLESLKQLKKHVEQTVGETMEAAIGTDLTGSVMSWYSKIRTKGDPDVHFSGFAMERTKSGDFKSRRLRVKAHSYGVELASAVSSLSESKLNALGLCVSIASALRSPGPWEFLVLDDPIQSWDDEHEVQFIQMIRALVEQESKQILLLSHRSQWINQVCLGCRSLNGLRYQITGYTKEGPHLAVVDWAPVDQRLREAEAIANDPKATAVRLQQAEQEIRLAACQIASEIAKKRLGRDRGPHSMNSRDVRNILNDAGYPAGLVDRVAASFGTTDDAHHAPKDYQPSAQRIRQYLGTLHELRNYEA